MSKIGLWPLKRPLPLAAFFVLGAFPALAQGTDAQREACAPDAVKLCPDTIPDVERTKACMQRRQAELSPRCRAVFSEAIGGAPARERRRASRDVAPPNDSVRPITRPRRVRPPGAAEAPRDEDVYARPPRGYGEEYDENAYSPDRVPPGYGPPGAREYRYLTPDGEEARGADPDDRERAREEISRLCEDGAMDPETCATTRRALGR